MIRRELIIDPYVDLYDNRLNALGRVGVRMRIAAWKENGTAEGCSMKALWHLAIDQEMAGEPLPVRS